MISSRKLEREKECSLALDIGTEAVKALVFEKLFDAAQGREKYSIEEKEVKSLSLKDFKNIIDDTHHLNSPQFINAILLCYAPLETRHGVQ